MAPSKHYVFLLHWDGRRWFAGLTPENYQVLSRQQLIQAKSVFDTIDAYPQRNKQWLNRQLGKKKKPTNVVLDVDDIEAVLGAPPEMIGDYHGFDVIELEETTLD